MSFEVQRTGDPNLDRVQARVAAAFAKPTPTPVGWVYLTGPRNYPVATADDVIVADVTAGNVAVYLSSAAPLKDRRIVVKCIFSGGANTVTVNAAKIAGTQQLIDAAATLTLSASGSFVRLVSDGKRWWSL